MRQIKGEIIMIETTDNHEIPKLTAEETADYKIVTNLISKYKNNKNWKDAIINYLYTGNDLNPVVIGALKATIFDSYQYSEQTAREINDLAYTCENLTLTVYNYHDLLDVSKMDWTKL